MDQCIVARLCLPTAHPIRSSVIDITIGYIKTLTKDVDMYLFVIVVTLYTGTPRLPCLNNHNSFSPSTFPSLTSGKDERCHSCRREDLKLSTFRCLPLFMCNAKKVTVSFLFVHEMVTPFRMGSSESIILS